MSRLLENGLKSVNPRGYQGGQGWLWWALTIPSELEKGNTDRIHPMAPEFAIFLQETPEKDRTGPVFRLNGRQGRYRQHRVSEIVSEIGEAAGVKVHTDPIDPAKVKYASAHDLRRAFGVRWASRLAPADLKVLMRHKSIETTLRYYVGTDAQRSADTFWDAPSVPMIGETPAFPLLE